jgi:hypothetical protein
MRLTRFLAPAAALLLALSVEAAAAPVPADAGVLATFQAPVTLSLSVAQDPPAPPRTDVTVQVEDSRTVWYLDPVWITVGLVAAGLVIALIVAASRSGGSGPTTVVK